MITLAPPPSRAALLAFVTALAKLAAKRDDARELDELKKTKYD